MERFRYLDQAESILWLKQDLIDRLTPIKSPKVSKDSSGTVRIDWDSADGNRGGRIELNFYSHIEKDGSEVRGENKMILSYIETCSGFDGNTKSIVRNSFESLTALLTMLAIINNCATKAGRPILHVVRASDGSAHFFERFISSNLYFYCNRFGRRTSIINKVNENLWTLYGCQFPIPDLENILHRFVIESASEYLLERYNQKINSLKLFISEIFGS